MRPKNPLKYDSAGSLEYGLNQSIKFNDLLLKKSSLSLGKCETLAV